MQTNLGYEIENIQRDCHLLSNFKFQIHGPAPNDTMWLNFTTYTTVFDIQAGSPYRLNPNSDFNTTYAVHDRAGGMQMAVIGFDGVSPLRDNRSTPQRHTIWVAYDVSFSLKMCSILIFNKIIMAFSMIHM